MGIIGSIAGRVIDVLDTLIDDQQANLRRILNNQGLEIKGVWETKEIFLFGSPLTLDILDKNNIVYEETEFSWGDDSEESDVTALAILLWFLDKNEAFQRKKDFLHDFLMTLPQADFETSFNYEYWRNGKIQRWGHTAQPQIDQAPEMDDD